MPPDIAAGGEVGEGLLLSFALTMALTIGGKHVGIKTKPASYRVWAEDSVKCLHFL